jgi:serpin B
VDAARGAQGDAELEEFAMHERHVRSNDIAADLGPGGRRRLGRAGYRVETLGFAALIVAIAIALATLTPGPAASARGTGGIGIGARFAGAEELTSFDRPLVVAPGGGSERVVALGEQGFGLGVLRQLVDEDNSGNVVVSPFSLEAALVMAELGAHGATASELTTALGLSGLSAAAEAEGWAGLEEDLTAGARADHVALEQASSIWAEEGFPIRARFLAALARQFDAGVWRAQFQSNPSAAVHAVNQWVSNATHGRITSLLQPSDVQDVAALLLNAVSFKAKWASPFTSSAAGSFLAPTGPVSATYLSGASQFLGATDGPGYDAVQLPYQSGSTDTSGRYAALLVMPTSGSLNRFVDHLDTSELRTIVQGLKGREVDVTIPKLKLDSSLQLEPALKALGVTDAFGPGADFSGLSPVPTMISEVKQDAMLDVTKWGTVASAATVVVIVPSSVAARPLELRFDRPFLFLVRDTQTGTLLFASAVNSPSTN